MKSPSFSKKQRVAKTKIENDLKILLSNKKFRQRNIKTMGKPVNSYNSNNIIIAK